jgi:hypothetical protein
MDETHCVCNCTSRMQVKQLVEDGHADAEVKDRWGATPLDEAKRVGSRSVAEYLSR